MTRLQENFIATVLYADIFDYPLSLSEVLMWSAVPMKIPSTINGINTSGEFIYIRGRKHILTLRKKRRRIAEHKWRIARRRAHIFRYIPSILLVGVTGGLAMNNAKKNDDIDLFIIVSRNTLWITRMIITVLSDFFRVRRRPGDLMVSDKICLNMFMSEDQAALPKEEQDLFTAHEVLQMVPLYEREGAYHTFLRANAWTKKYLPNAYKKAYQGICIRYYGSVIRNTLTVTLFFLEPLAKAFQLWYMRNRRTTEVIQPGMIRFHPNDAREWIRKKYAVRLKKWNIPLDNVFYHR